MPGRESPQIRDADESGQCGDGEEEAEGFARVLEVRRLVLSGQSYVSPQMSAAPARRRDRTPPTGFHLPYRDAL